MSSIDGVSNGVDMAADLQNLIDKEIPDGRHTMEQSYANLERVAAFCEANYHQAGDKMQALEETRRYTVQSLASVAYQINTLASNILHMLDLQTDKINDMESQVNNIAQVVNIHKEKVARREIGVLTTNKNQSRQHKIVAPANPEKSQRYQRRPIDYSILDDLGHGVKLSNQPMGTISSRQLVNRTASNVSGGSSGSAASQQYWLQQQQQQQHDQAIYMAGRGSLSKSSGKEYRVPVTIAPPQPPLPTENVNPYGSGGLPSHHYQQQQQQQGSNAGSGGIYAQQSSYPPTIQSGMSLNSSGSSGMTATGGMMMGGGGGGQQQLLQQQHSVPSLGRNSSYNTSGVGGPPPSMVAAPPPAPPPPPPPIMAGGMSGPIRVNTAAAAAAAAGGAVTAGRMSSSIDEQSFPPPPSPGAGDGFGYAQNSPPLPPPPMDDNVVDLGGGMSMMPQYGTYVRRPGSHALPDWVPQNYIEKVVAVYDYQAEKPDELTFVENSVIYVLKKNEDGWYEGVLDGVTGLFPGNYVEPYTLSRIMQTKLAVSAAQRVRSLSPQPSPATKNMYMTRL